MRVAWRDLVFLSGFGCVVCGAFIVWLPLGLIVLGVPLMWYAVHEEKQGGKKGRPHDR